MNQNCKTCNREYHNGPALLAHELQCGNRIFRQKRTVSEEYGDIRQSFDMWLDSANLPDRAEWEIKDVQSALDKLAEFIPSEAKANCPICGGAYPLHEWNCTLNQSSRDSV